MRVALLSSMVVSSVGCWSAPHAVPAQAVASALPSTRVAIMHGDVVRVLEVSEAGVRAVQEVDLPIHGRALAWVGAEPVVQLTGEVFDEATSDAAPALLGSIGRITAKGFVPYPALAKSTWNATPPADEADAFEVSRWDMMVTHEGVWQGHCGFALPYDDQPCIAWEWARIDAPSPRREEPKPTAGYRPASIAPPAAPRVTIEPHVSAPRADEVAETVHRLKCVDGARTFLYPELDDLEYGVDTSTGLVWVSATPPIYQAVHLRAGYDGIVERVTFEGCAKSATFEYAELAPGPHELTVLFNGTVASIRWRGRELGRVPGGTDVAFAPVAP